MKKNVQEMIKEISEKAKTNLDESKETGQNKNQVVGATDKKVQLLEEGTYFAILKNGVYLENIPAKYGLADAIDLELEVYQMNEKYGSMEKTNIKERLFKSPNAYSPYYVHLSELLGRDPQDGFNTSELIGKVLEITIVHNHTEKRSYANLDTLRVLDIKNIKEVL